jgi:hypothetical protein
VTLLPLVMAGLLSLNPDSTLAGPPPVTIPVLLDSVPVYVATGADSAGAAAEAAHVAEVLQTLRGRRARPQTVQLAEQAGVGQVWVDSTVVLEVRDANRVDPQASPLANALRLRDRALTAGRGDIRWEEEELLLRLLLGVVYPVSLLVLLRMMRFALRRLERQWRRGVLGWIHQMAIRRGMPEAEEQGRRVVDFLTGIERLAVFGIAFVGVSFTWFALFPQTRPLAGSLLDHVLAPLLQILGGTARGFLLLVYSVIVVLVATWITRRVANRRQAPVGSVFDDPLVHVPVRIGIWVVALFLLLFPYPGAPRQFAVGVLLLLLLASLIALRPIIEEIASGLYLNSQYELGLGSQFTLDGASCTVVSAGLVHMQVARGGVVHRIAYSRILKSDFAPAPRPGEEL